MIIPNLPDAMSERTKPFYVWADCHNAVSSDLQKINLQTTNYELSRDVEWEVSLKAIDFYIRGSALAAIAGTGGIEDIRMWSVHMSTLNPERITFIMSATIMKGPAANMNQILRFILVKGTAAGGTVRFSEEFPRAEYLPIQDYDLRRVTFQAVEHASQLISGSSSTDYRVINTVTPFDEMLLLLHFRPRSTIPLSAYSLFDNGYDFDTSKEFTYTLSSQQSPTQSPLNPYMRLPQTMRLDTNQKYDWTVAVTQISYNPYGVIPITITGTGGFSKDASVVLHPVTIQANITLQMLCNMKNKLAPYLVKQFNDAMIAQTPPSLADETVVVVPSMALALVQNRWQLSLTSFRLDYTQSNIEEKLLVPYMGFVTANRTAETSHGTSSTRRATNSWSPQLCESLYVRAPNIVYTDEFMVYNGNRPETFIQNTLYRVVFDSDAVLDPNGVNIVVETPQWISIGFESFNWFETNLVVALSNAESIYNAEIQALLTGVTYVTLTFRMQLKGFTHDDD